MLLTLDEDCFLRVCDMSKAFGLWPPWLESAALCSLLTNFDFSVWLKGFCYIGAPSYVVAKVIFV